MLTPEQRERVWRRRLQVFQWQRERENRLLPLPSTSWTFNDCHMVDYGGLSGWEMYNRREHREFAYRERHQP